MTPLSKDLYDALHADGYHIVTRQEWYRQQGQIARLETTLVEMWGNVEMILEYKLGDFPQPEHYANHVEIYAEKALSSTAGEAAANRMAALERVAEAARDWMDLHWDGNTPTPPDASAREWMELSYTMKDKERALKDAVKKLEAMET